MLKNKESDTFICSRLTYVFVCTIQIQKKTFHWSISVQHTILESQRIASSHHQCIRCMWHSIHVWLCPGWAVSVSRQCHRCIWVRSPATTIVGRFMLRQEQPPQVKPHPYTYSCINVCCQAISFLSLYQFSIHSCWCDWLCVCLFARLFLTIVSPYLLYQFNSIN